MAWLGLAFTALVVGVALVFAPAARADFGATEAELASDASLHPSELSCGPTSGCLIADTAHRVPDGEDGKVITAVDVFLPVGSYVVDVVVMDVSDGSPTEYTVLSKSATTPSPAAGGGVRRLTLMTPLALGTSVPTVGLLIRGFSGRVTFRFNDTRDSASLRRSNASAWLGRTGEPGETVRGFPPDDVMSDPDRPELDGNFALMPARFITSEPAVGADLRITKTSRKPTYKAPRGQLQFKLVVTNLGPRAAKQVSVTDTIASPFNPFLRITRIFSPRRVTCKEVRRHPPKVVCKTKKMKNGDKFTVFIRARIAASLPVLAAQNVILGAPFKYFNDAAVNAKQPADPIDANNSATATFKISTGRFKCPSAIIKGTAFEDFILIGPGVAKTALGLGGHDRLEGGHRRDCILGGEGRDFLDGRRGVDWLDGGPGSDEINVALTSGGPGDRIWGGLGNDEIFAANLRADVIDCGPGKDTVLADKRDRVARNCEKVRRRLVFRPPG